MTRLPPCSAVRHPLARATFWSSTAALAWTQVGYGAFLAVLRRAPRGAASNPPEPDALPAGDADHRGATIEQNVIAPQVENAKALDFPRGLVIVVACAALPSPTRPRSGPAKAGADLVLELPRGGKIRAQDAAVEQGHDHEIVAFSDANATLEGARRAA